MANIVRRDAFSDLAASWQHDIDRMFRSLAESFGRFGSMTPERAEWSPAADIITKGDDVVIRFELPGIEPERDVEITVEDGALHIRGERQERHEEKGEGFIRRETSYGAFERTVPLPPGAKTDDVRATYSNGILEVKVPGGAKRATQRVPVEVKDKRT